MNDARTESYHSAIKILSKYPEWPKYKEWIMSQITGLTTLTVQPIISEDDKQKHNCTSGMIAAFKVMMDIDNMINNAEEFEKNMQERIDKINKKG